MDEAAIRDLFAPLGPVSIRRMFGGAGVYLDGLIVAIVVSHELYLKVDDVTREAFRAAGSTPFTYVAKGRAVTLPYWSLPDEAYEAPDLFRPWGEHALAAARRAPQARKPPRTRRAG